MKKFNVGDSVKLKDGRVGVVEDYDEKYYYIKDANTNIVKIRKNVKDEEVPNLSEEDVIKNCKIIEDKIQNFAFSKRNESKKNIKKAFYIIEFDKQLMNLLNTINFRNFKSGNGSPLANNVEEAKDYSDGFFETEEEFYEKYDIHNSKSYFAVPQALIETYYDIYYDYDTSSFKLDFYIDGYYRSKKVYKKIIKKHCN